MFTNVWTSNHFSNNNIYRIHFNTENVRFRQYRRRRQPPRIPRTTTNSASKVGNKFSDINLWRLLGIDMSARKMIKSYSYWMYHDSWYRCLRGSCSFHLPVIIFIVYIVIAVYISVVNCISHTGDMLGLPYWNYLNISCVFFSTFHQLCNKSLD